ncbi:putative serine esterase-domain-containing protein [Elsinoe ampelina]|uniref:Putative serine esterase-domain-containing protein n=1 Tax=Elsinoe ampelina TaxID=302913 RepID=A0A6A6G500_9PEZI|nr:putative serine esterase-domain-containing protein [Elsinoe ampelina]
MESISGKADHLVVLVHGMWGQPSHLEYLSKSLRESYDQDQIHILVAKSNANTYTYDGIETGGERITHEIEAEIKKIEESGTSIRKLSVIGYSMGGLVARYAIGLLYSAGLFKTVEAVNFTTFATPHLGVRAPITGKASQIWNVLGARTLSTSGQQMFLVDKFRDTGRPLLHVLADPSSIFIRGLSQFRHRTLYANILNDRSVVYYTAAISSTDPYANLDLVQLHPLTDTDSVILDPSHPVSHKTPTTPPLLSRLRSAATTTVTSIPWAFFLTVLLPVGTVFFLTSAGIQTIRSAQRRKLHDSGKTGVQVEKYRSAPFMVDELRSVADRVYNAAANTAGGEEYLPTPPPEEAEREPLVKGSRETLVEGKEVGDEAGGSEKWPTLALTKEQFEMIDALDGVGFTKYRVHITTVRHSHAAIVVRTPWRPGFGQGRTVVKHWVEKFVV